MMPKPKDAMWHFAANDRKLAYHDGRSIVIGETLKVEPPIRLCRRGLHASKWAIDALAYATGAYACLVTLGGQIEHGDDKSVATERTVIAAADATNLLFQFAIDCAARAMERTGWDHEDSWNALSIRAAHMQGLADDADLFAAGNASLAVAENALLGAAGAAAQDAAQAVAWSAAWTAARDASGAAAGAAACSTARSAAQAAAGISLAAERQIQNEELERRLLALLRVKQRAIHRDGEIR